jgi:hypothetical protein
MFFGRFSRDLPTRGKVRPAMSESIDRTTHAGAGALLDSRERNT